MFCMQEALSICTFVLFCFGFYFQATVLRVYSLGSNIASGASEWSKGERGKSEIRSYKVLRIEPGSAFYLLCYLSSPKAWV